MGVDIADVRGREPRALQGDPHALRRSDPVRVGRGHVIGVLGVRVAREFCVNFSAARPRVLLGLEDNGAAALADDEAVVSDVEGPAGMFRIIVAARQGLGLCEARYEDGRDDGFATCADHDIGLAAFHDHGRSHDGVAARGACRIERHAGAAEAILDGNESGRHVAEHHGYETGPDLVHGSSGNPVLSFGHESHAVHCRAHNHARAFGIRAFGESGVRQCLGRGSEGELREQGHIARERAGDVVAGIEIADLSGYAHGKIPGVEAGDGPDAASAADEVLPVGVHADAERRDRSHSCDDQFFLFHNFIGLQEPGMRAGPGCR